MNAIVTRHETLVEWKEKDPFAQYLNSPFKKAGLKTEALLKKELKMIEARDIVMYTFHPAGSRRAGQDWPRADRAPSHPGVVITFEKPAEQGQWAKLRFPCNTYSRWEDNLRAVALALEALRKVDRYGVTTGAQYTGYKALPPAPLGSEQQTPEQAAEFVARAAELDPATYTQLILTNVRLAGWAYQTAAKRFHPDKPGGSQDEFAKLEVSMRIVREQHPKSAT